MTFINKHNSKEELTKSWGDSGKFIELRKVAMNEVLSSVKKTTNKGMDIGRGNTGNGIYGTLLQFLCLRCLVSFLKASEYCFFKLDSQITVNHRFVFKN